MTRYAEICRFSLSNWYFSLECDQNNCYDWLHLIQNAEKQNKNSGGSMIPQSVFTITKGGAYNIFANISLKNTRNWKMFAGGGGGPHRQRSQPLNLSKETVFGGSSGSALPLPKFLHFHAVFVKNWPKNRLAPPLLGLAPPPTTVTEWLVRRYHLEMLVKLSGQRVTVTH